MAEPEHGCRNGAGRERKLVVMNHSCCRNASRLGRKTMLGFHTVDSRQQTATSARGVRRYSSQTSDSLDSQEHTT